ncbi:HipA N-terminal domain-containing protein [Bacterioplanoides pacificum]|uniref:HipA N-terminal domain-containing protein n=1 Tax=Bacterioplanoides pacificum TaxID=1171596 RepID=A0ABV7VTM7_9GAMM
MNRAGRVYFNGRLAGRLEQTEAGFTFAYERDYLAGGTPISFRIPLQAEIFEYDQLPVFFAGLVSEGWMRKLQSKEQHIDENDVFGLLLANGEDLIGAVTVLPEGQGNE